MHPRAPSESADVVARPLSMVFEKSWQPGQVPGDWEKGDILSIFKKGINGADPLRSWAKAHGVQGDDSGQPAQLRQGKQFLPDQLNSIL